uniref:Sulfotransferase domain-containing protein n=1 Tax=Compsopogon caeruleus TaxID=31354 RepID=A0A7S1THU5_9RHOD|mmetsp:Transcript_7886/g.15846  ORF Transcript_7886/g.15846 Transcript_7886/m.15846 type:complete len:409 (+) Transcript_7886:98-1324(+)|eukprot:CAMPEP_0184682782 /NCGR_PEP_ID=MMETSP0312-20130426/8736_1 /TAXON_ID=31354 /ORGANISM="Compsopogon coeruleus, Strain SAG 36.94" /LENGTH=408 /DNA_ID=CAMNT_0027134685 /DNA_START=15 /DNA_END=1241 /DNA_ORIENTATION=+
MNEVRKVMVRKGSKIGKIVWWLLSVVLVVSGLVAYWKISMDLAMLSPLHDDPGLKKAVQASKCQPMQWPEGWDDPGPAEPFVSNGSRHCSVGLTFERSEKSLPDVIDDPISLQSGANTVCLRAFTCKCRRFYRREARCNSLSGLFDFRENVIREEVAGEAFFKGTGPLSSSLPVNDNTKPLHKDYFRFDRQGHINLIIKPSLQLVFVKVHKSGSTFVRSAMRAMTKEEDNESFSARLDYTKVQNYTWFLTVRDPMKRFFSQRQELLEGAPNVANLSYLNFKEYVDAIYYGSGINDFHARSQLYYLQGSYGPSYTPIRVDYIVRMEHIKEDVQYLFGDYLKLANFNLEELDHRSDLITHEGQYTSNPSEPSSLSEVKDPDLIRKICEIVAQDHICFGYPIPPQCTCESA